MNGRTRFLTCKNSLSGYLAGDGERSAGVGEVSWAGNDVRLGCGLSAECCATGSKYVEWREQLVIKQGINCHPTQF